MVKNFIKERYQLEPTLTTLSSYLSLQKRIEQANFDILKKDQQIQSVKIDKDNQLIALLTFDLYLSFDYQQYYRQITLNEQVVNKLRFDKKSPYLYQRVDYEKGVYFFNNLLFSNLEKSLIIEQILVDEIKEITKQLSIEEYEISSLSKFSIILKNNQNDRIGFCLTEYNEEIKEASILWLQIEPAFQKQRYTSVLLNELLIRLQVVARFITVSFPKDNRLHQFFSNHGFINWAVWCVYTLIPRQLIQSETDLINKRLELSYSKKRPHILIHSCCGPCSTSVLDDLSKDFDITIYYYNPNIYPSSEFTYRLEAQRKLIDLLSKNIALVVPEYNDQEFYQVIKGYQHLSEGSKRCFLCYEQRLRKAAQYAKNNGFDYFTTTLSISPYKNASKINEIGEQLAKEYDIYFLYSNFKLKGGYQKSIALSKQYHLYRQEYCGCIYSKQEMENKLRKTSDLLKNDD